jgi:uncharacterized protein (DUF927 family)
MITQLSELEQFQQICKESQSTPSFRDHFVVAQPVLEMISEGQSGICFVACDIGKETNGMSFANALEERKTLGSPYVIAYDLRAEEPLFCIKLLATDEKTKLERTLAQGFDTFNERVVEDQYYWFYKAEKDQLPETNHSAVEIIKHGLVPIKTPGPWKIQLFEERHLNCLLGALKETTNLSPTELPEGFAIDEGRLTVRKTVKDRKTKETSVEFISIAAQCHIIAKGLSAAGEANHHLVQFIDHRDAMRSHAISTALLHSDEKRYIAQLIDLGFEVENDRAFISFVKRSLAELQLPQFDVVQALGWQESKDQKLSFAALDRIIGSPDCRVVAPGLKNGFSTQGNLEGWQTTLKEFGRRDAKILFAACLSLSGPLLRFTNLGTGGFHLSGQSSFGKTSCLRVAASVWGSAEDNADPAFMLNFNTTVNSAEASAKSRNDCILLLDESGNVNERVDLNELIYRLSSGREKSRLTRDARQHKGGSWSLQILSTGEKALTSLTPEQKAGAAVRMIDIPFEERAFSAPGLTIDGTKALADRMQAELKNSFGLAGPAFIEALREKFQTYAHLSKYLSEEMKTTLNNGQPEDPAVQRALGRFKLVETAGRLAADLKILPFEKEEITHAVQEVSEMWLRNYAPTVSDAVRGIIGLREFIIKNQRNFQPVDRDDSDDDYDCDTRGARNTIFGYVDKDKGLYLFTEESFKEACSGIDTRIVLKALEEKGLLKKTNGHGLKYQKRIRPHGKGSEMRATFIAVMKTVSEFTPPLSGSVLKCPETKMDNQDSGNAMSD